MATGPIVLAFFAAIWAVMGLSQRLDDPWAPVIAVIPSLIIILVALRLAGRLPRRSADERRRVGRLVGVWSAVEGVAIFFGITIVTNLGHPELNAAVMCLAVGLHFFPLARGLPRPTFYLPGVLLTALGLGGLIFGTALAATVIEFAAAGGLWLAASLGLLDLRRAAVAHTKL